MTGYISPPSTTDPDDIASDALQYLSDNINGFVPRDGHLEVWQIHALANIAAEAQDVASAAPLSIFKYYGSSLLNIQPISAVAATIPTTWVMNDNAGYTINAGTQVGWRSSGDTIIPFIVQDDVVIPPGSAATAAGAVVLVAVDTGSAGNGLGPGPMILLDSLAFVTSVTATAASTGGVDEEDDAVYLSRLNDELRLLSPRPIFASDFAVLARNVAGVKRAVAVDNYNPADGTHNNERMVGVAAVDEDGNAIDLTTKGNLDTYLEGLREVNFVINVFDAQFSNIDIDFQYTIEPSADPVLVRNAAIAALIDFLQPYNWGTDKADTAKVTWTNLTTVRYNDVIAVLYNIDGLRSVTSLTINTVAGDHLMPGEVALPRPNNITGALAP